MQLRVVQYPANHLWWVERKRWWGWEPVRRDGYREQQCALAFAARYRQGPIAVPA